jgi:hypothetical protein
MKFTTTRRLERCSRLIHYYTDVAYLEKWVAITFPQLRALSKYFVFQDRGHFKSG